MSQNLAPQTIAAANGTATDTPFGPVAPPLYPSSTFAFADFAPARSYDYTRTAHPSRAMLADTIAQLECGAGGVAVASRMAALDLVLSQLQPGDLIIAPHDRYGGTYRLLAARRDRTQFEVAFVDPADDAAMSKALSPTPRCCLIQTPSNPLLRIADTRATGRLAKAVGSKVVVDNTFPSPALQKPITLGADFVIHSTTKYLDGHSDVVGGVVIASDIADVRKLIDWANITDISGAPFDAYSTLRGIGTLFPRIQAQQQSAALLARFLQQHARVRAVYYPGLETHPGHTVATSQQTGFGAMLSFDRRGMSTTFASS